MTKGSDTGALCEEATWNPTKCPKCGDEAFYVDAGAVYCYSCDSCDWVSGEKPIKVLLADEPLSAPRPGADELLERAARLLERLRRQTVMRLDDPLRAEIDVFRADYDRSRGGR